MRARVSMLGRDWTRAFLRANLTAPTVSVMPVSRMRPSGIMPTMAAVAPKTEAWRLSELVSWRWKSMAPSGMMTSASTLMMVFRVFMSGAAGFFMRLASADNLPA